LGTEVVKVDCEQGILTLADGKTITRDLVVIADGAHSRLLEDFLGAPSTVIPTGRSIYRWLVPMDRVLADPDLGPLYSDHLPGFMSVLDSQRDIFWITYSCRDNTVLNCACVHATQPGDIEGADVWHSPVTRDHVHAYLAGFHPTMTKLVHMANQDGITVHQLFKRPALSTFVRGKTLIVGDAAHVMMPTHAAGGAIAIESAATLEVLFSSVDGKDGAAVAQRLRLFDQLRIPRCNLTMVASNAGPRWLHVAGVEDEVRRFYPGKLAPKGTLPWSRLFREMLFDHDEYAAAERALAAAAQAGTSARI